MDGPLLLTLRHPCFATSPPLFLFPFLEILPYFQGPTFYDDTLKVSTHSLPTFAPTLAICCYENHVRYVTTLCLEKDKILDWNSRKPTLLSEIRTKKKEEEEEEEEEGQEEKENAGTGYNPNIH